MTRRSQSSNYHLSAFKIHKQAPSAPEGFRDSGISTGGPIYAISTKVKERNDLLDNANAEDLYLCVDNDENYKKNE